ncbi:hypothetical protein [Burkholderia sp. RF2-non_BP3]|uniref:hypothetical protein n=1 Tax=Burkholderia sp. RF2-non_BP3 TaxID=1637844 RepID=UPI0012E3BB7E|nr:hypothetical protein [Burkholderia sp. RF2-non_BP3]
MLRILLIFSFFLAFAASAHAKIQFANEWSEPENSDVRKYDKSGATNFLRGESDDLKRIIDSPDACVLQVTKGCHQKSDPHFTVNGMSSSKCKVDNLYAHTKSVHVPCRP